MLQALDLSVLGLQKDAVIDSKLVALLSAQGLSASDIANRLDIAESRVELILMRPETTSLVFKLQSALRFSPEQQIEAALPRAVEKKIFLMLHSSDEKVQSACATEIIDRARGKPVQTMLTGTLNQNDDLQQVDKNFQALQERLAKLEEQREVLKRSRNGNGKVIDVEANEIKG